MTWLDSHSCAALLEISERHLRRITAEGNRPQATGNSQIRTRARGRATEYLLESLPVEAQARYFQRNVSENDSPVAVTAGDRGEGDAADTPGPAADSASAALPATLSAGNTHRQAQGVVSPSNHRQQALRPRSGQAIGMSEEELERLNDLADRLRQQATGNRQQQEILARHLGWSVSTLRRKIRALDKHGVVGLARKTRADRGRARVADDKVVARIKGEFLQPYRPSAAEIHRAVAKDFQLSNMPPPSYSFVRRQIGEIDGALIARFRLGEREFDDKYAYVTLRKKPAAPRLWCDADHHKIDHVVEFADGSLGRPWLTAIHDICTNEILGYVLSRENRAAYPGSRAIGLALRKAVLPKTAGISNLKSQIPEWPSYGIFENFYTDLGKDFRSQHIRAVCHDLGTTPVPTRGYHGKSKPIERFFGTLENGLKHLPGYVGRSPETNPLKAHIGAAREWESLRGEALKIDDFEAALYRWIVGVYHHTESKALKGLSPMGALEAHVKNGWRARAVASERALDLLLMSRAKKKVQRYGIQLFSSAHIQRYFMAPELVDIINQEVEVYWDPENIGEIVVYYRDRFLCKASNRQLLDYGATEEDLKSERELKKKQRDSVRARFDELAKRAQYPDDLARAVAENRLDKVVEEEREKIAVNAQAPSVPVLMPKYQQAANKIAAVPNVPTRRAVPKVPAERPSWLPDEDLKPGYERFKRPPRPSWMEDDDDA